MQRQRIWILGSVVAIAGGVLTLAWRDAPRPANRTVAARPMPWDDRPDRVEPPPPEGYTPAWQVRPPRPRGEPAPVVLSSQPTVVEAVHTVDGDRPPRPIPGLR